MNFIIFISLILIHEYTVIDIDLGDAELPNNILKFGYGINYKYMGKVSHSFDIFYIVTKFELPKVENLQFDDIPYDADCAHLDNSRSGQIIGIIRDIKCYCVKIAPHIDYYRKQIAYYNQTATNILTNELALLLPTFPHTKQTKEKYYYISYNRFYRPSI